MTIVAWDGASAYNKDSYRAIRIDGRRFLSTTPITVAYLAAAVGRDSTYQFFQERERDFPDVVLRVSDVLHLYDGDAFYGIPPCTMAGAALPAEPPKVNPVIEWLYAASEDELFTVISILPQAVVTRLLAAFYPVPAEHPKKCESCGGDPARCSSNWCQRKRDELVPAEHAPPDANDDNPRAALDDIWKRRSSEWCKHIEWDDPDLERAVAIAERALTTLRGSRPALAGSPETIRDRDELWCRALTVLPVEQIQKVTAEFNAHRPDRGPCGD